MEKKGARLVWISCFLGCSLMGLTKAAWGAEKKKNESLPVLMHSFYATLIELKPFMVSLDDFKNPANKAKVQSLLTGLETKIDSTQVKDLKAPGFNVTYDLLARHLRDTSYLYEKEIYETAWNNVRATTQFCIACHDRLPKGTGKLSWPVDPQLKALPVAAQLREADFYYIGHQFEPALELYDSVIRSFQSDPKKPEALKDLELAYQRKIAYFARIQRRPQAAVDSLKLDLKNKGLPLDTQKNIEDWIRYFELWAQEGKSDPSLLKDGALVDYARQIVEKNVAGRRVSVSDPSVVNLLRVSGLLYERVFKQPKSSSSQEMMYLLARCEQDLAPIRSYSLADIFFRDCVLQDPKTSVAKKCFSDYEVSIKQRYRTGASDYINEGLESLRRLLK